LCALIALGVYIAFLYSLSDRLNITSRNLQALEIPKVDVKDQSTKVQPPAIVNLCARLDQLDKRLVTMKTIDDECIITLNGNNLFASGSVVINASFEATLDSIAREIKAIQDIPLNVIVSGHTDNDPLSARLALIYRDNGGLSQARAESVKERLDQYLGSTNHRTTAEGYGAFFLVDKTQEGRARNRRVELSVKQYTPKQHNRSGVE
ncbi:MAG: OmpA family protein, partial [Betaproteobacteria bacterium]|nr:OmpA family protein [Betaproteobacteria bacterium]